MVQRHWVRGISIRLELLVFNLFSSIARYRCNFAEDGVAIDGGDDPVDDKMASPLCKVQYHKVTRAGAVVRAHAPSFLHDRGFGHPRVLHDAP
jgi:hypothetical protein